MSGSVSANGKNFLSDKANKKYTVDTPTHSKATRVSTWRSPYALTLTREIFTSCRLNFRTNNNESRRLGVGRIHERNCCERAHRQRFHGNGKLRHRAGNISLYAQPNGVPLLSRNKKESRAYPDSITASACILCKLREIVSTARGAATPVVRYSAVPRIE